MNAVLVALFRLIPILLPNKSRISIYSGLSKTLTTHFLAKSPEKLLRLNLKRTHLNYIRNAIDEPDIEPIYKGGINTSESNSAETYKLKTTLFPASNPKTWWGCPDLNRGLESPSLQA